MNYNIICGKYCGDIIDIKTENKFKKIKLNDELFTKFSVSEEDINKLLKEANEELVIVFGKRCERFKESLTQACEYKFCPRCRKNDVEDHLSRDRDSLQLMMRENNSQYYDRDIIMENKKRYNLLRKHEKFGKLSWNSITYNKNYFDDLTSISDDKLTDFEYQFIKV